MGLMSTLAIGAAGYWLYRSGRLDPYVRQLKDSAFFQQLKDRAGLGSTTTTPSTTTGSYGASADLADPSPSMASTGATAPASDYRAVQGISTPGTMGGKEVEPYA